MRQSVQGLLGVALTETHLRAIDLSKSVHAELSVAVDRLLELGWHPDDLEWHSDMGMFPRVDEAEPTRGAVPLTPTKRESIWCCGQYSPALGKKVEVFYVDHWFERTKEDQAAENAFILFRVVPVWIRPDPEPPPPGSPTTPRHHPFKEPPRPRFTLDLGEDDK